MKLNKFIHIGLLAIVGFCANQQAFAASSDDETIHQSSCMVTLSDDKTTRMVNVEYIRELEVDRNDNVLDVRMASTYGNRGAFKFKYKTENEALKALQELTDKINDCQYNVAKKRKLK